MDEYVGLAHQFKAPKGNVVRWCTNPKLMVQEVFLSRDTGKVLRCYYTERLINFFIADTAAVRASPWSEELMMLEHEDFFLKMQRKGGLTLLYCPDMVRVCVCVCVCACDGWQHN